ncbi:MAG: hypothetical protein JWN32_973 [Solirubrobacterales bacterium]|jgi:hypothetical protein|nr:hypothetical protein [Solirubrobacterales bacterium]
MQVATMTARLRTRTFRPTAPARRTHRVEVAPLELERARLAGGPEDRALYKCGCGLAFQADVSASVGCPQCGSAQAW